MSKLSNASKAAAAFCPDPANCRLSPLGRGNINDTFLVESTGTAFVLQRINSRVFPEPLHVINNFAKITSHLQEKSRCGDTVFRTAQPMPTLAGSLAYRDAEGEYWRAQTYLAHASCRSLSGPRQVYEIGRALARFHELAADLKSEDLVDPLPGFHDLIAYLKEFDSLSPIKRQEDLDEACGYCLGLIDQGRQRATRLQTVKNSGLLPVQPIHGDPKIDNFLFNDQGLAEGMLDLDTVSIGLVHSDLGDCLRSCCNRAGESGGEDAVVTFDLEICRDLLVGYFSGRHPLQSPEQRAYIYDAVLGISFELALRFFSDHLRGNVYFKVCQDGDNLLRAVRQFQLVEAIIAEEEKIRASILASCR